LPSVVFRIAFNSVNVRLSFTASALTIGIANNRDTPLLEESDHAVWLDTGPEPIAGSTRMKAGTAQRIALNLLSSLVMILLGRVYEGLMVDVQAVNNKLVQRSESMLLHLTGRSSEEIRDALARAHGSVKLALLLLQGCEPDEAAEALDRAHGQRRRPPRAPAERPAVHRGIHPARDRDAAACQPATRGRRDSPYRSPSPVSAPCYSSMPRAAAWCARSGNSRMKHHFATGMAMPDLTTDDGVRLYYE